MEQQYKGRQKALEKNKPDEKQAVREHSTSINRCLKCGFINESSALYCEKCGASLSYRTCPYCGSSVPEEADLCEHCKNYLANDICSFCGAKMGENDAFCPECGSPRRGIVCPVCHSLSVFSFCPRCGTALNELARKQLDQFKQQPLYKKISEAAKELENLLHVEPVDSLLQKEKEKKNAELRERVLRLLNVEFDLPKNNSINGAGLDSKLLGELIQMKRDLFQRMLDSLEMNSIDNPAMARNYAMARRPLGSSLGWKCNYKHAIHSGPYSCACPQLGGKWVILDGRSEHKIVDEE